MELCVVEAVTNVITHAYHSQNNHPVECIFSMEDSTLTMEIVDAGDSMDLACFQRARTNSLNYDPTDLEALPDEGFGLPIINTLVDSLEYECEQGKNRLILTKHFHHLDEKMSDQKR